MVEDGGWDAWVSVGDLLDLVGQSEHHLREQLRVGLKHVRSMALGQENRRTVIAVQSSEEPISQQATKIFNTNIIL